MDDTSAGLRYDPQGDDALSTLRQQARSMSHGLQTDVDRAGSFALGTGAGTDMTAGLLSADDPEALAELLRERADREPDLRLRRLVERAEHALDRGDATAAWELTDEALGIDRTSATVWLLRGRVLIALEEFGRAHEVIAVARRYARDAHGVRLADAISATCHREEMRVFADRLAALVAQGRVADAVAAVRRRLTDHPDDPTLLRSHCRLLLLADEVAAARQVAESALRVVGRNDVEGFEELLRVIAREECTPRIRDARLALRRGDTTTAVVRLDECLAALGDDPNFTALRSYALKRHTEASSFAVVRRMRKRRDDSEPIPSDRLQQLIEWIVQEELDAGWAAFQAGRFTEATQQFTAAAVIDARCALVALLHGAALFQELLRHLETARPPRLDHAHGLLLKAREQAARCLDDPTVGARGRELQESINAALEVVETVRARVARVEAVNSCITRFTTLMQHYRRFPIRTPDQRTNAQRDFGALAQRVQQLQRQGSTDPEEQKVLRELGGALSSVKQQLRGW